MTDLRTRLHPRFHSEVARTVLSTPVFDWIRAGADTNEAAYRRQRPTPRVLVDVSDVDVGSAVLGAVHPEAEAGVARELAAVATFDALPAVAAALCGIARPMRRVV